MSRTIFFDLDATLYSYQHGHKQGLQTAYVHWVKITGENFEEFHTRYIKSRSDVKRFLKGSVANHSRALYFQGMLESYYKISKPYDTAELTQRYWDAFLSSIIPFDNAREVLLKLKSEGYGLGIITNMSAEIQLRKLHNLGLDDLFDVIVTSEEAGQQKPHPHIYLHAMNRFTPSLQPQDCIMIGDSWEHDVEAPEFIGMKGILVTMDLDEIDTSKKCTTASTFDELYSKIHEIYAEPLDGVIKYKLLHRTANLDVLHVQLKHLINLRDRLWTLHLIGVYPHDYYMTPNVGFGNASQRYSDDGQFLISGSQTGGKETTTPTDYALVTHYVIDENELISKGPIKPSSEALTHAAIYEIAPEIRCVIHVHSKKLWDAYEELNMPTTPENVLYGTPQMARAIQSTYDEHPHLSRPVCMRGHIEGLLTWGKSTDEALKIYLDALNDLK